MNNMYNFSVCTCIHVFLTLETYDEARKFLEKVLNASSSELPSDFDSTAPNIKKRSEKKFHCQNVYSTHIFVTFNYQRNAYLISCYSSVLNRVIFLVYHLTL